MYTPEQLHAMNDATLKEVVREVLFRGRSRYLGALFSANWIVMLEETRRRGWTESVTLAPKISGWRVDLFDKGGLIPFASAKHRLMPQAFAIASVLACQKDVGRA